jgi:AraC family transcriptional regulator
MPEREATKLDYGRRVARAMAFVAANLDGPLDLERVAAAAAFSPCHFHRIFRALAGETLGAYVTRIKLQRAAKDLIDAVLPLPRIARRAGYAGVAAFTRAFRTAYGVPPAAYRTQRGIGTPNPNQPSLQEPTMYTVTLADFPALRLAAIRQTGPYMTIGASFDRVQAWGAARGLIGPATRFFGLYHDDPKSVPEAQCRADAGFTIGPDLAGEGEVRIVEVPATRAAVLRFQGPYAEIEAPYEWFYGTWLPQSGHEPSDLPGLEEYLNDPRSTPPAQLLTDIIMPLARARVPA